MVRKFETTDLDEFNRQIANDYTALMKAAKTDDEARKLAKQSQKDQDRLQAMYERIRGVYQIGDPDNPWLRAGDRKSTRLNSSHLVISYAVFCLKKKTQIKETYKNITRIQNNRNVNIKNVPHGLLIISTPH